MFLSFPHSCCILGRYDTIVIKIMVPGSFKKTIKKRTVIVMIIII